MSQKLKVELQDENGNIYYLHTAADVVYLDDGTTVEAALEKKVNASGGDISNTKLATLAAASASFPVPAAGDAPKTLWGKAKKWQQDCLAKFANYVLTSAITNQYLNDTSKIPTAALMYLLKQEVNGLNSDIAEFSPVYREMSPTSQFDPLGLSYSLKFGKLVYVHLGFTTTKQAGDGDDVAQLIDNGIGEFKSISTVAFTSRQGGVATFKIVDGSRNLKIGEVPPEANHTYIIDAIFRLK